MAIEIEMKARVADFHAVEEHLAAIAERIREFVREDRYYAVQKHGNHDPLKEERLLASLTQLIPSLPNSIPSIAKTFPSTDVRIRHDGAQWYCTYKERYMDERGYAGEVNRETEFEITDADAFIQLLERFDYSCFIKKRKSGTLYVYPIEYGTLHAELVLVDNLGYFLEIEYIADEQCISDNSINIEIIFNNIMKLFEKVGIKREEIEQRRYIEMLRMAQRGTRDEDIV